MKALSRSPAASLVVDDTSPISSDLAKGGVLKRRGRGWQDEQIKRNELRAQEIFDEVRNPVTQERESPAMITYKLVLECFISLLGGGMLFSVFQVASPWLRLWFVLCLVGATYSQGLISKFADTRRVGMRAFNTSTDDWCWCLFVWGKYLAVASLEVMMCVSRLHQQQKSGLVAQLLQWVPATLLAINIIECAMLEARIAHNWRHVGWGGAGAALNVVTGVALTVLCFLQPLVQQHTYTADAYQFNHSWLFTVGYIFWNTKFASVAQDVGMIWHVGQSHTFPAICSFLYGWDYMHTRVPALLFHFTGGLVSGPPDQPIQPELRGMGFGYFF